MTIVQTTKAEAKQTIIEYGATGQKGALTIPAELLKSLATPMRPLPVTISGSNNVTFTLAGATTPFHIWIGQFLQYSAANVTYTWNATSNPILNSAGVETTDANSELGIWYMYAYRNTSNGITLIPSQTKPAYTVSSYGGYLEHPGASKVRAYSYVGFMLCTTAATPAFKAMTKVGYTYNTAVLSVATTATWAELAFTGAKALPAHIGLTCGGYLETGSAGTVAISGSATEDQGVQIANSNAGVDTMPFSNVPITANGKVWAKDTVARGDVHVTTITDLV
jgi:hypothetical protein